MRTSGAWSFDPSTKTPLVGYCANCGQSLQAPAALTCSQCGTQSPAGTKFCPNCGNGLQAAPAAGT